MRAAAVVTRGARRGFPAVPFGLVLLAWAVSEPLVLEPGSRGRLAALAVALGLTLPLLALARRPVAAASVVTATYLLATGLGTRPVGAVAAELALGLALFGASALRRPGTWARRAGPLLGGGGLALGVLLHLADVGAFATATERTLLYLVAVVVVAVVPAMLLADRRDELRARRRAVAVLEARAAADVDDAVRRERRELDRSMTWIVTRLVDEIRGLTLSALAALPGDPRGAGAAARRVATVTASAGDSMRELLGRLQPPDAPTSDGDGAPPPAGPRRLRAWAMLALAGPPLLLALHGVVDQLLVPDLPLERTAWGRTFRVEGPALGPTAAVVLAALTPLPLLARRRAPLAAVGLTMAIVVARTAEGGLSSVTVTQTFVGVTCAWVAGAWARSPAQAWAGGALALGGTAASWALEEAVFTVAQYAYLAAAIVAAWGVGRAVSARVREAAAARDEAVALAARRDALAAAAVAGERRRVAHELHDIVGHGLSLVAVQAGAAAALADRDPTRAAAALQHVRAATDGTLDELAALQGTLDADGPDDPRGAPTVRRVVADAIAAGEAVGAHVDPAVDDVPGVVSAVVVRTLQEALTNARRHAPGAAVDVELRVLAEQLVLRVRSAGPPGTPGTRGSGVGLAGMTERVATLGGRLVAGPDAGGGWLVHAEVPLVGVQVAAGAPRSREA
ncbi:histidine kinase [Patulibacter brassicae]|uniref:histidine kinase n=1 Tax=Patulibacter brassicae TaxID=1705717 RepID=A0ABU4VID0_9ACTN|nr:histidine kinase [Patulibacter brassicae]MDX8150663.1 histidine kinase [Patulibacter brassicae]